MSRHSITPKEIDKHIAQWPGDRYVLRHVNGEHGQHWAVCYATTWGIVTLSYTKAEATRILREFNTRSNPKKGAAHHDHQGH